MPRETKKKIEEMLGYRIKTSSFDYQMQVMPFTFGEKGSGWWDPKTNKVSYTTDVTHYTIL